MKETRYMKVASNTWANLVRARYMATTSSHDGYPLAYDIGAAILALEDMLSGADEDRGSDTRISEVIRLLRHLDNN